MTRKWSLLLAPITIALLTGCGGNDKKSIAFDFEADERTGFAVSEIKAAATKANFDIAESKGDITVSFLLDEALGEQSYRIAKDEKTITVTGGDAVGLMYGGLDVAEALNMHGNFDKLEAREHHPHVQYRGVSVRPPMDLRTPSYTNNGDSTRWNLENTWDLDYWKGLFDIMARMRYNILSFATVNSIASMIKVPGFEECALEDVYEYTGEYDDTYLGNCTNMFRPEHLAEGNYRVVKKMTIDEKTAFWKDVMQAAHDRGITWQYSMMTIYTFAEEGHYGITAERDNENTKNYFKTAFKTLLETFPHIDQIKTTCGENMDYPIAEEAITTKWYRDVFGDPVKEVLDKDPERAKRFSLGFAGVGNTQLSDTFFSHWTDYPYHLHVNKRYNDTRLLSVTKCTDNDEYLANMPSGWDMIYNVRGEDAYHLTWGDPDFAREFARNIKQNRVQGWHFAIDGYYVSGKEYEFKDDSLNGDYYYNRHWAMYSMFGRMGYEPDSVSNQDWENLYVHHYDVGSEAAKLGYQAMTTAGKIMPNIICQYQPGGTDAAFLPEMCSSNPTLFGFLDIKRFINSDQADPDSDIMSFAEYAQRINAGETSFAKRTPLEVAQELNRLADETINLVKQARETAKTEDIAFLEHLKDQETFALLARYYADKFNGAVALRRYNDTSDETYKTQAVDYLTKGVEDWKAFAALWFSRFKVERLPRHGIIDPNAFTSEVEKDVQTASKWRHRDY